MNNITQDILCKQAVVEYSLKYGVTKAAIRYKQHRKTRYRWREKYDGTDINIGVYGKRVLAVKAGTVVTSTALRNSYGEYRSYGEYIVIDHHDGTMTLYGHMSPNSRTVSKGDEVTQGQVIGVVGTTGNSTGYHLHFEVRINGRCVNPLPYLQ